MACDCSVFRTLSYQIRALPHRTLFPSFRCTTAHCHGLLFANSECRISVDENPMLLQADRVVGGHHFFVFVLFLFLFFFFLNFLK